ncbi:hypothetical protein OS175_03510 [Marinicella sp. S1101]|uniref:tetratricopeptide repeat protein n=1 Tax=Marinicella marina TaxID=2996016 RepID=UPI00226088B1|nr:hypothetical protein [Marinicella marina]MCX7552935.1 hypothetical protein [Marinicella marina]MDJ1139755.1 hypothetical protein [Marinicella marina]
MLIKFLKLFGLLALLLLAWFSYKNGLSGGFIFDDVSNLSDLSIIDNDVSLKNIQTYFGESTSGPLKRPISIFSFLIDAQDWPAEAYSFKRTNVIIHLLNGGLLFLLLSLIFSNKAGVNKKTAYFLTVFGCAFWLLHPFLVSTTLYVVQRMAMLPLTFMLMGFSLYVKGRCSYQGSVGKQGKITLFLAVYLMTLLAMLSKENGIIYLWLIALFECFIIQGYLSFRALSKSLRLWLLILPGIGLALLILIQLPSFIADYDLRIFNMWERLLTQTRATTMYLYHWFIPSYFTEGVFTDGFGHSKSLLDPISTLFSSLFVLGLLGLAWFKRRRWVWFSFSVFFFFTSQVLESTIVPLELYFEHRIYVGSIFLSIPLLILLSNLVQQSKIFLLIPLLISLMLAGMTFMRSDIWSNNLQLFDLTMNKYPESVRARMSTAMVYEQSGLIDDALQVVNDGIELHDNLELKFNQFSVFCVRQQLTIEQMESLYVEIGQQYFTKHDHRPFINLVRVMFEYECLGEQTNDAVFALAEAVENNPNTKVRAKLASTNYIKGQVYFRQNEFELSKQLYLASFSVSRNEYEAMHTAIIQFINAGEYKHAEDILNFEKQLYAENQKYEVDWLAIGDTIEGFTELIERRKNE